jgi:hypothetical protein
MSEEKQFLDKLEQIVDNMDREDEEGKRLKQEAIDAVAAHYIKTGTKLPVPEPKVFDHEDIDTCLEDGDGKEELLMPEHEAEEDPCPHHGVYYDDMSPEQQDEFLDWQFRLSNRRHQIFIHEMVAHGNRRIAYQKAYPGVKDSTAYANAYKLMQYTEIAAAITEGRLKLQQQTNELLRQSYKGKIADIEEKREVLAQIIRRELVKETETVKTADRQWVRELSNPRELIKAILADNKLEDEWRRVIALPNPVLYGKTA